MATTKRKKSSETNDPPIQNQPQSKTQAAAQAGVFLHTDSAWSDAYWDSNDLHCEERILFG